MAKISDISTEFAISIDWSLEPDIPGLRTSLSLLKTDPQAAFGLLSSLLSRGSIMSMVYLGSAYKRGLFGEKDLTSAAHFYAQASCRGSKIGTYLLGRTYFEMGHYEKAKREFEIGVNDRFPPAAQELGRMYWIGAGVEQNIVSARALLGEAANLGSVRAKGMLGRLLLETSSGSHDASRGLVLIMEASAQLLKRKLQRLFR